MYVPCLKMTRNNVWATTDNGIIKIAINNSQKKIGDYEFISTSFGADEGLDDRDFGTRAICKTRKGEIVIGGANGYNIYLSPTLLTHINQLPNYHLQTLTLETTKSRLASNIIIGFVLNKGFELLDRIDISSNDYVFNVGFSFFDYVRPSAVRYSYQLDDTNTEWINLKDNKIYFNNLKSGLHKLRIKAGYVDHSTTEVVKEMKINVHPPLWLSRIAFVLYFVIAVYLGFWIYKMARRRQNEKLRLQQIEIEAVRQHEVDEMKLRFFTNISHDIRTPLSLIINPLEKLIAEYPDSSIKKTLDLMSHNANHLMKLLDQLLDFRKLDVGAESLTLYHGNFVTFIKECVADFEVYKEKKDISLSVLTEAEGIEMSFDKDKIQKVMMNLLSNAFQIHSPGRCHSCFY